MAADHAFEQQARSMLRQRGQRVTTPRATVLATMLAASAEARAQRGSLSAFSHQDLSTLLESARARPHLGALDRVTLYRVLEWMVEIGLAHKIAGDDRVFRFSLNAPPEVSSSTAQASAARGDESGHAHFHCDGCHRVYCLRESPRLAEALQAALPQGFVGKELAITVRGLCPDCAES